MSSQSPTTVSAATPPQPLDLVGSTTHAQSIVKEEEERREQERREQERAERERGEARFSLRDEGSSKVNLPQTFGMSSGSLSNYINQLFSGKEGGESMISLVEPLPADPPRNHQTEVSESIEDTDPINLMVRASAQAREALEQSESEAIPINANPLALATTTTNTNTTTATTTTSTAITSTPQLTTASPRKDSHYIDITEYLNMPQNEAAKKLGVPTSTLSKRWKEATMHRKWPYRTVSKLDKEIMTILHNIPQGNGQQLSPELEDSLAFLLRKRQQELRCTVIRL